MILYLRWELIKIFFRGKSDGGLNIYNFSKIVIQSISNVKWINDCFIINCDRNRKNMVRIIWRYYFLYSFSHNFQTFNIFFKKSSKIKLFTFFNSDDKRFLYCF